MNFPIELALILAGVALLAAVIARRRFLENKYFLNREKMREKFNGQVPESALELALSAPKARGDGTYSIKGESVVRFSNNYDRLAANRRMYLAQWNRIELLLLPEPSNFERKLAVAISFDSMVLGYLPSKFEVQMHKYLLAHETGILVDAKIYLGSRPDFNEIALDLATPIKVKTPGRFSKRKSKPQQ